MGEKDIRPEMMDKRDRLRKAMMNIGVGLESWANEKTPITHGGARKVLAVEAMAATSLIAIFGPEMKVTLDQFNAMALGNGRSVISFADNPGEQSIANLMGGSVSEIMEQTVNNILKSGGPLDSEGLETLTEVGKLAKQAEQTKQFGVLVGLLIASKTIFDLGIGYVKETNKEQVIRSSTLSLLGKTIQRMAKFPNN